MDQYKKEGNSWDHLMYRLRNQKESYNSLIQIRCNWMTQLEDAARNDQLNILLNKFEIGDAEFEDIVETVKTDLFKSSFYTTDDFTEGLIKITSIRIFKELKQLEWRKDLERELQFDLDTVSSDVRAGLGKVLDALKSSIESDLIDGARRLSSIKQQFEAQREKLIPELTQAQRDLANSAKDLEIARNDKRIRRIIIWQICAFTFQFIIGLIIMIQNWL